jgi:hypothetical protein
MIRWVKMAKFVIVSWFGSEGKCGAEFFQKVDAKLDRMGAPPHQHHSILVLRRGKEPKGPFKGLLYFFHYYCYLYFYLY